MKRLAGGKINSRWLSLRLLEGDTTLNSSISECLGDGFLNNPSLFAALASAKEMLTNAGITKEKLKDLIVSSLVKAAEEICRGTVIYEKKQYRGADR